MIDKRLCGGDMYSLIDLDRYKPEEKHWCGYVLECAKEQAIYTGISNNIEQRLRQHMIGKGLAADFTQVYGPPIRVLELYFCSTVEQVRDWERQTSEQLYARYGRERPVYYIGRRSISNPHRRNVKEWRKHKITEAGMLAYMHWLKR